LSPGGWYLGQPDLQLALGLEGGNGDAFARAGRVCADRGDRPVRRCRTCDAGHAAITANNTSFQFNTPSYARYSTNQPLTGGLDVSYTF
jgi:hypothetical protein